MVGTKAGGLKAAATNKKEYGEDFYAKIGNMGGRASGIKKGFALDPALARAAGAKGGRKSKRGWDYEKEWKYARRKAIKMRRKGFSYVEIADTVGIPYASLRNRIIKEIGK